MLLPLLTRWTAHFWVHVLFGFGLSGKEKKLDSLNDLYFKLGLNNDYQLLQEVKLATGPASSMVFGHYQYLLHCLD